MADRRGLHQCCAPNTLAYLSLLKGQLRLMCTLADTVVEVDGQCAPDAKDDLAQLLAYHVHLLHAELDTAVTRVRVQNILRDTEVLTPARVVVDWPCEKNASAN